jgi:hypothetical protein
MASFKPYFEVSIPKEYSPEERRAIAAEIIDYVISRTEDGKKIGGKEDFPDYSKKYAEEKGQENVDLTFSGDMLMNMELLKQKSGALRIGYSSDYEELGKVEGNVLGTYGKSKPIKGKARNFLGITKEELNSILSNYPIKDRESRLERVIDVKLSGRVADSILSNTGIEIDED